MQKARLESPVCADHQRSDSLQWDRAHYQHHWTQKRHLYSGQCGQLPVHGAGGLVWLCGHGETLHGHRG